LILPDCRITVKHPLLSGSQVLISGISFDAVQSYTAALFTRIEQVSLKLERMRSRGFSRRLDCHDEDVYELAFGNLIIS
jgi:hypothetical protein